MMNFDGAKWIVSPSDNSIKGLNDSGIETFRGHLVQALAREICQNSVDARKDRTKPVVVEFSAFNTSIDNFPNNEEYKEELMRIEHFWKMRKNEQVGAFFEETMPKFKKNLSWMRISDFNTTGLTGVSQADNLWDATTWNSLVRADGDSQKDGIGSFGIGKSAPFSCSYFRTVFYATKATFENKVGFLRTETVEEEGFIGVARLLARPIGQNSKNTLTSGKMFFEKENCQVCSRCISLDPAFKREETGTDIYIPGFIPMYRGNGWVDEIVEAVINSFLYAIYQENLIVKIKTSEKNITLDKAYLDETYGNSTFSSNEKFNFTIQQKYQLLASPDVHSALFKLSGYEGYVDVRFLLGSPDYDRRITVVRAPGMKIFDKDHISGKIAFTGMVIVCGDGLNKLFKNLENPAHTEWEINRSVEGAKAMKDLFAFCKGLLKSLVMTNVTEEIDSGLGAILPQEDGDGSKQETDSITPISRSIERGKSTKRGKNPPKEDEDENEDDTPAGYTPTDEPGSGGGEHGSSKSKNTEKKKDGSLEGDQNGPNEGDNTELKGEDEKTHSGKKSLIKILQERSCCIDRKEGRYRFIFTPSKNVKNASLTLYSAAEADFYYAPLCSAKNHETGEELKVNVETSSIEGLKLKKKKPVVLELTFDYSDYLSLEVECYEHN